MCVQGRHINPRTKKQSEERAASPTRASPSHAAALAVTLCRDSQPTQSEIQKVGPPVRPMCSSLADNRRALQNCLTLRNFPGASRPGTMSRFRTPLAAGGASETWDSVARLRVWGRSRSNFISTAGLRNSPSRGRAFLMEAVTD
jgi:hypothetical protein